MASEQVSYTYLQALRTLANGCKDHPAYRAFRKPRSDCEMCRYVYDARRILSTHDAAHDA